MDTNKLKIVLWPFTSWISELGYNPVLKRATDGIDIQNFWFQSRSHWRKITQNLRNIWNLKTAREAKFCNVTNIAERKNAIRFKAQCNKKCKLKLVSYMSIKVLLAVAWNNEDCLPLPQKPNTLRKTEVAVLILVRLQYRRDSNLVSHAPALKMTQFTRPMLILLKNIQHLFLLSKI